MLAVLCSFAQEESKIMSDNAKWWHRKRFQEGKLFINTNRFLGYDKDENGGLVINQAEAEVIKRIFKDYLEGSGPFIIAKELNIEETPTVSGGRWHENTVKYILQNEKYMVIS